MKKPFKVGDRVRVYIGLDEPLEGKILEIGQTTGHLRLEEHFGFYHPKQCRRLIKKKRRRVWLMYTHESDLMSAYGKKPPACPAGSSFSEFIEVKKK